MDSEFSTTEQVMLTAVSVIVSGLGVCVLTIGVQMLLLLMKR